MFFYLCAEKFKLTGMQKLIALLLIFAGFTFQLLAQDDTQFVFDNNPHALDISSIEVNSFRDHPLGIEVSKKLELLESRYTYIVEATPTSPVDKTVVIKPVIYNSILKLYRYFKKEVRDENILLQDAKKELLNCLNIALIIYAENTEEFEDYLRKARKPEQILEVYGKVILQ